VVETLTQVCSTFPKWICCFPLGLLKSAFNGVAGGKHQPLPKAPLEGKVDPKGGVILLHFPKVDFAPLS